MLLERAREGGVTAGISLTATAVARVPKKIWIPGPPPTARHTLWRGRGHLDVVHGSWGTARRAAGGGKWFGVDICWSIQHDTEECCRSPRVATGVIRLSVVLFCFTKLLQS